MIEVSEEAKTQLRAGKKIAAIKIVREANRVGLKEAKDTVDAHISQNEELYPELKSVQMSARSVMAFLIVGLGLVLLFFVNNQ